MGSRPTALNASARSLKAPTVPTTNSPSPTWRNCKTTWCRCRLARCKTWCDRRPCGINPPSAGFLRWDGRLTRESPEAGFYEVWLKEIGRSLGRRISEAHSGHYDSLSPHEVLALLEHPGQDLFGENPLAARDALLADALKDARMELERRLGPEPQWTWGNLHSMHFRHPLDRQAGADELLDLEPLPRPGDGYTVNATGFDESWISWEQIEGASYREIIDTGDWDRSVAVNTPGQSGQPGSAHYADLLPLWNAGRYFPLSYTRTAVEQHTVDRLHLLP